MGDFALKVYHKDDSHTWEAYSSIADALSVEYGSDSEYGPMFEFGKTVHGRDYAMNVTEDFIAAWIKREEEYATETYWDRNVLEETGETLDHYLESNCNGPIMRVPSKRKQFQLEAAE